jgi:2-polyprenyl-3-methyl-5-hydroxy-6-metoxy-1,4-benzoquinol methylase
VSAIASRIKASDRGTRVLCDYLTIIGFLTKSGQSYALTPDAAAFLTRKSPAYLGGTIEFLASPDIVRNFDDLAATIRRGTAKANTVSEANPVWTAFARAMAPMMVPAAQAIADALEIGAAGAVKVLDIAAGHGIFGITLAQRNPRAEIVAVDWPAVLAVAGEHAAKMGVKERHHGLPGDAFAVDFGTGFDVALVTNFLHHFDAATCTIFMKKVAAALTSGGRVAVLEFVPNDDRISPVIPAQFSLTMLAGTPHGDAYTLPELRRILEDAGFGGMTTVQLPTSQTVITARKTN